MHLHNNGLTGRVPPNLGDLSSVDVLNLFNNDLSGPLPATFGVCRSWSTSTCRTTPKCSASSPGARIPRANGTVPGRPHGTLRAQLRGVPGMAGYRAALANRILPYGRPVTCLPDAGRSVAGAPGSLIANERALLRVFVTAPKATDAKIHPCAPKFYRDDSVVHVITLRADQSPFRWNWRKASCRSRRTPMFPRGWYDRGCRW